MGIFGSIGKALGGGLGKLPGAGAAGGALGAVPGAKALTGALPGGAALGGALGVGGAKPAVPGAAPGGLAGKFAALKKPTATSSMTVPGPAPGLGGGVPSLAAAPDLGGDAAMSAGPAVEKSLGKKSIFGGRAMRGGRR